MLPFIPDFAQRDNADLLFTLNLINSFTNNSFRDLCDRLTLMCLSWNMAENSIPDPFEETSRQQLNVDQDVSDIEFDRLKTTIMVKAKGKRVDKYFKKLATSVAFQNLHAGVEESVSAYLESARPKSYVYHDVEFTSFVFGREPGTDGLVLSIRIKFVKRTRRKDMSSVIYRNLRDRVCLLS
jgi:hypothetical protein